MNTLKIENMSFGYGKKKIYDGYSLTLKDGINVFLGPNGCGKTTFFKILATIYEKRSGKITLNGINYENVHEIKKRISYIPQNFNVYPSLKVKDFMELMSKLKIEDKAKRAPEVERVSAQAEIGGFMNKPMKRLSEGMRRRVGIAQALLGEPAMLIADEPTAGLDPEQRSNFNILLKSIGKGRIILMSTHIIEDIHSFYDNITIIQNGRTAFNGDYEKLIHSVDGKAYTACTPVEKVREIRDKYIVTRVEIGKETAKYRIIGDPDPGDFTSVEAFSPELRDIWIYFRKVNSRGENADAESGKHDE